MKYRCLIADDNMMDRDLLSLYLGNLEQLQIVAECAGGLEALQHLAMGQIDILFCDVEMPDLNGLGLVKTLRQPPVTVLISAHSEYAAEGFDLDVVDFMVKPVTRERVIRSVSKAIEYLGLKQLPSEAPARPEPEADFFYIRESNDFVRLYYRDVAYIESMGNFSKIYTADDKRHITLVSLKSLESQLPASLFSRIHRQYIINHELITAISTEEIRINGRFVLPLGQLYRQELLDKVVHKQLITRNAGK